MSSYASKEDHQIHRRQTGIRWATHLRCRLKKKALVLDVPQPAPFQDHPTSASPAAKNACARNRDLDLLWDALDEVKARGLDVPMLRARS
jgi:hypothetical protein